MSSDRKSSWHRQILRSLGHFAALEGLLVALTTCGGNDPKPSSPPETPLKIKIIPSDIPDNFCSLEPARYIFPGQSQTAPPNDPSIPDFRQTEDYRPAQGIGADIIAHLSRIPNLQDNGIIQSFPETGNDGALLRQVILTFCYSQEKITVSALIGPGQKPNLKVTTTPHLIEIFPSNEPVCHFPKGFEPIYVFGPDNMPIGGLSLYKRLWLLAHMEQILKSQSQPYFPAPL